MTEKGHVGAAPKSVNTHLLDGTYRADRHQVLIEPDRTRELPAKPDHILGNTKLDREAVFDFWANYLYGEGHTREIDGIIVGQLVEAYIQYTKAINASRNDPEAMYGKVLASYVALKWAKEIRDILAEFRLTPSARVNTRQEKKDAGVPLDPVGEFLKVAKQAAPHAQ